MSLTYGAGGVGLGPAILNSTFGYDRASEDRGNKGGNRNDEGSKLHFVGIEVIVFWSGFDF